MLKALSTSLAFVGLIIVLVSGSGINTIRKYLRENQDWSKKVNGVIRVTEEGEREMTKLFGLREETEVIDLSEQDKNFYHALISDYRFQLKAQQNLLEDKNYQVNDLNNEIDLLKNKLNEQEIEHLNKIKTLEMEYESLKQEMEYKNKAKWYEFWKKQK